jgi:chromate transporter
MIALIQHEVVEKNGWLTLQEFTDIVATSQMTPGPIGINVATYTGFTAIMNAGYAEWMAIFGSFLASFAVILLPFLLMLLITNFLLRYRHHPRVEEVLKILRITVVGLIAAAALLLLTPENFGSWNQNRYQLICSVIIFLVTFIASSRFKASPILLIILCGIVGVLLYGI